MLSILFLFMMRATALCSGRLLIQLSSAPLIGQIGVELRVVHLTEEYWGLVVSHCMNEIQSGRTPNPDMLCNSRVKFGELTAGSH